MKIHVDHVAKLANLPLTPVEIKKFDTQLSEVLTYIEKLNQVNTEHIEPTSQVTGLENVLRDDEASSSLPQKLALSNAKTKHNNLFQVKGIFENE